MENHGTMTTTELLFALLRSEITGSAESIITEPLSEDTLNELYHFAKAHDIAHILSSALHKQGLLGKDEISQKFLNKQMLSVYRYEQLKYAFEEICSVFEKEQIAYIPLKGSVLRSYYPEEWMRTSCDIDILVHEEDLSRAVDALVDTGGYKTDYKRHYHDISLHSSNGIHLELHFNIKENMDNIDRMLSKVWDYSKRDIDQCFHYNQTNEYFVFHHIAHMSYHFISGGCGIKPFIDLYIIKNKMNYDDSLVRNYCKQCGIEDFCNNVLYLTDVWFSDKPHTPLSYQIEEYILKGGVYGTLENKVVVAQSKQDGKVKYIFSRLFMPYDDLKIYYPVLTKHKWLLPLMQVRRWIRFLIKGSFKRGVQEFRVNKNVSKSQISNMNDFLRDIGLQ